MYHEFDKKENVLNVGHATQNTHLIWSVFYSICFANVKTSKLTQRRL